MTILRHIRNSLSHPNAKSPDDEFVQSGYTTIPTESGLIEKFCFIGSPDVLRNYEIRSYESPDEVKKSFTELLSKNENKFGIKETNVNGKEKFQLWSKNINKPVVRVFRIDIPLTNLKTLTMKLSNALAQPVRDDWNADDIDNLVYENWSTSCNVQENLKINM